MPLYEIVKPCAYVADGIPVLHKTVGAVVELTPEQAAYLGNRVHRAPDPAAKKTPQVSEKGQTT